MSSTLGKQRDWENFFVKTRNSSHEAHLANLSLITFWTVMALIIFKGLFSNQLEKEFLLSLSFLKETAIEKGDFSIGLNNYWANLLGFPLLLNATYIFWVATKKHLAKFVSSTVIIAVLTSIVINLNLSVKVEIFTVASALALICFIGVKHTPLKENYVYNILARILIGTSFTVALTVNGLSGFALMLFTSLAFILLGLFLFGMAQVISVIIDAFPPRIDSSEEK